MSFDELDEILDTAPCGFIAFIDDGTIIQINATLSAMLGWSAATLIGRKIESIFTLATRIFYQTHFFPLLKLQGKAAEIFLSLLNAERVEIPVLANAQRKEQGNGVFINQCILISVNQRQKYEEEIRQAKKIAETALLNNEQLQQAKHELAQHAQELDRKINKLEQKNRELESLTHILHHHLQEPIRKIELFADVLCEDNKTTLTAAGKATIDRIHAACKRMDQLLKLLQQFVSLDAANPIYEKADLNQLVAQAKSKVSEKTGVGEILLNCELLPTVEGVSSQLELLFYHLIDNSVKYRRQTATPTIEISCCVLQQNSFMSIKEKYRYVDFVRLVYSDNSIGFEQQYSESVFRLLTTTDTNTAQAGCGLAMCKKIVENHYGSIAVASESGNGVKFTIILPLKQ